MMQLKMIRQQIENLCYINKLSDTDIIARFGYVVKQVRNQDYLYNARGENLARLIGLDINSLAVSIYNAQGSEVRNKELIYY